MAKVKIVPFPFVAGPQGPVGPQGPQGVQGPAGAAAQFPQPVIWNPVLRATGFVQSSNPSSGAYLKYGRMVFVHFTVPLSAVTNFGTGQYKITLPFTSHQHTDAWGGTIHDVSTGSFYSIKGHIDSDSNELELWYVSTIAKDEPFDFNSPFSLDNTDLFHMAFWYETEQ
jgi:hypothetical protein